MRNRLYAIVNPASGQRDHLAAVRRVRDALKAQNADLTVHVSEKRGDIERLARSLAEDAEAVLVVGGDGTVNELVNGLGNRPLPVLIWSRGTANLSADGRATPGPEEVVRFLLHGVAGAVDLGVSNGRYFHSVAGVGFDASCLQRMRRSSHIGYGDYFWPIWRAFWEFEPSSMRVIADEREVFAGKCLLLVGNQRRYGPGIVAFPSASRCDGKLDLCVIPLGSRRDLLIQGLRFLRGRHTGRGGVVCCQFSRLVVTSRGPLPMQMDGDWIGDYRGTIEACPGMLHLLGAAQPSNSIEGQKIG
ncbi:MAG: diacylglycerol/lipid kinase family protein [Planctomycetota bacterium]